MSEIRTLFPTGRENNRPVPNDETMYEIDTSAYLNAYGVNPKGIDWWLFAVQGDAPYKLDWYYLGYGDYEDCKSKAIVGASEVGISRDKKIYVDT